MELADSVAGDAHKFLNVVCLHYSGLSPIQLLTDSRKPYDCGFFFTQHPLLSQTVFKNPNAAYLSVAPSTSGKSVSIASPLNIGIENSRRFRALPVYATLVAYGRSFYVQLLAKQIRFARSIAKLLFAHPEYELLPSVTPGSSIGLAETPGGAVTAGSFHVSTWEEQEQGVFIIVLFRAKDEKLNEKLVLNINQMRKMYVSATKWEGKQACRIAICSWLVDGERDLKVVGEVLKDVVA